MLTVKQLGLALAIAAAAGTVPVAAGATNLKPHEMRSANLSADPNFRGVSTPAGVRARRAELARGNHQTNKGFINLSGRYVPKFNVTGRRTRSLLRY